MKEVDLPNLPARLIAFSPDNKTLALAGPEPAIMLWDSALKKTSQRFPLAPVPHTSLAGSVRALAFSPDGALLAASEQNRQVILWETATGRKNRQWSFDEEIKALAFSSDGRHLAAGSGDGTIYILRIRNLKK